MGGQWYNRVRSFVCSCNAGTATGEDMELIVGLLIEAGNNVKYLVRSSKVIK